MAKRKITEFFDYGSSFYTVGGWIFDLIALNVIWLFTSGAVVVAALFYLFGHTSLKNISPILGYGLILLAILFWCPATIAMYYTLSKKVRKHDAHTYREYFQSYRINFKQSFLLSLMITFLALLMAYNIYLMRTFPDMFGPFTHAVYIMQIVIVAELLFFTIHAIALQARLTYSMKDLIRNAFIMANKHILASILCAVIVFIDFWLIYYVNLAYLLFAVVPGILCVVVVMEKMVLSHYIPDEEELEKVILENPDAENVMINLKVDKKKEDEDEDEDDFIDLDEFIDEEDEALDEPNSDEKPENNEGKEIKS